MAPGSQGLFRVCGPQVACGHVSGLSSRHRPQALMGSVDRGLIRLAGSRCPMSSDRSPSIRRSTDDAITLLHPRKSCGCVGRAKFSNLIMMSVAAVAARRIDRLQLLEVEFGNGLQLFRQPRPVEAGRQSLPRRRPGLSSQARYSSCRSIRAATAAAQRLGRDGVRRSGGAGGVWFSRRIRARRRAWRWAGVIGTAPIRRPGMLSLQQQS